MTEAVVNPAANTTLVGGNFQVIGKRIYAYSGEVDGSDVEVITVFSDRTPADTRYHLKIFQDINTSGNFTGYVAINGIQIAKFFVDGGPVNWSTTPLEIVVGPDTLVEVKAFDVSSGADHFVRIIGKEF